MANITFGVAMFREKKGGKRHEVKVRPVSNSRLEGPTVSSGWREPPKKANHLVESRSSVGATGGGAEARNKRCPVELRKCLRNDVKAHVPVVLPPNCVVDSYTLISNCT
ncbi:hypothetical protein KM043_017015 [Ampulex compressa]|nr:hypothetical protein KM043_017015 [Ampulex compressa]